MYDIVCMYVCMHVCMYVRRNLEGRHSVLYHYLVEYYMK